MQESAGLGPLSSNGWIIFGALVLPVAAGMWRAFQKAGFPGWATFVPIYNAYVILRIGGKPDIWLLLWYIPFVGLVILLLTLLSIAEKFGKSSGFAVALFFLPFIFWPILGFGDTQYKAGKSE